MQKSTQILCASLLGFLSVIPAATAQEEIAPPQGAGRIVIVLSGASGADHYRQVAQVIAKQGYDVLLYDGNAMAGSHGDALKAAVAAAPQLATHALPGKIGLSDFRWVAASRWDMRRAGATVSPLSLPGIQRLVRSPTPPAGHPVSRYPLLCSREKPTPTGAVA
jgi:hypothetical protein